MTRSELLALLLEVRQTPPHPPQQQCSCIDSLSVPLSLPLLSFAGFALLAFVTVHSVDSLWSFSHGR